MMRARSIVIVLLPLLPLAVLSTALFSAGGVSWADQRDLKAGLPYQLCQAVSDCRLRNIVLCPSSPPCETAYPCVTGCTLFAFDRWCMGSSPDICHDLGPIDCGEPIEGECRLDELLFECYCANPQPHAGYNCSSVFGCEQIKVDE